MRVLFMGTPDIAATCLEGLLASRHEVVGAVCQPDKPRGRGMVLTPPPVKVTAERAGLAVYQPESLKDGAFLPVLEQTRPDVIAVVAYGKILPPYILEYPKYGCINVHVSLLPKYRGAAPMQRAIMEGEKETGVTVMQMDEGMDTGDILLTEAFPIGPADNFEVIHDRSAAVGAALLVRVLDELPSGTILPRRQPAEGVSYAAKITKEDQAIDFSLPAAVLDARIRGLSPIPLAFTKTPDGRLLKIVRATPAEGRFSGAPGEVIAVSDKGEGEIVVACGEGALSLRVLLPEGKSKMTAADLLRGRRIARGDILSL